MWKWPEIWTASSKSMSFTRGTGMRRSMSRFSGCRDPGRPGKEKENSGLCFDYWQDC
jgi:hypothetical protein